MKILGSGRHFSVFSSILIGFLATTILIALLHIKFKIYVFGWSVNFIPIGALIAGALASSLYGFMCKSLHVRAGASILLQVVVIASASFFLFYYLEYILANRVALQGSFVDFLNRIITLQDVYFGHQDQPLGRAGQYGYIIFAADWAAYVTGGLFALLLLRGALVCDVCDLYLRRIGRLSQHFTEQGSFLHNFAQTASHRGNATAIAEDLGAGIGKAAGQVGEIKVASSLLECPHCRKNVIRQWALVRVPNKVSSAPSWRPIEGSTRTFEVAGEPAIRRRFGA